VDEKAAVMENTQGAATAARNPAHSEYSRRLEQCQAQIAVLQHKHLWYGNARIAVFAAIFVLAWRTAKSGPLVLYLLFAAIALFIALVIFHRRIVRTSNHAKRALAFYTRGIARMEDRWAGSGEAGNEFKVPLHLYAEDLDILGDGSLFQLLCIARTRMGRQMLAQWLLTHGSLQEIAERQAAVAELKAKLDFRQDLAAVGESETIQADPAALAAWTDETTSLKDGRWWALLLATLNIAALVYGFMAHWAPFIVLLLVNGSIMFRARHQLEKLFARLGETHKNLDSLAALLRRIEGENFTSPMLQRLQSEFIAHGRPSECIARLDTLADLEDSRHNWFVRLFDVPLLYSLQVAFALENWRRKYGRGIKVWLNVVGQMEALQCIAAYAYEHPEDPFPEFAPAEAGSVLEGESLGHPLLPADQCVRNNAKLGGRNQVLLVSGSNMSGKSTYLRVIGINAVLAMMGAPVRARRLRLSHIAVGASMRVADSLQKGISHFYAEIKRLRQVVDLSSQPTLFLLDEVLQGTNSHDRRVGTEGVLRTLIRNGAIGLVTTHDLALTSLEQVFPDRVSNVHFQERFEDDRLSFDYCLRSGVVTTSNGLELMKSIGLDVP
jgi:hypothetical protein